MLYLLDKHTTTVKWNGEPLYEAESAIVKEELNGDFSLQMKYPSTDSGIYKRLREDMLIKAPTPDLGFQLFRIKKPIENNDHIDVMAYHISDDVMKRSIAPMSVVKLDCRTALSIMVQNAKTNLGRFSFTSDISKERTFNTDESKTLYSVLLDGKHSIVGTWEGELVRDNYALTIKKNRGEDRGVIITTHHNLHDYHRTRDSQNVVTRIYATSTFKAEGAEEETVLSVTVESPYIDHYPYVNEKEYQNNDLKTVEELRKWAEAKFKHEHIDLISDAVKIEAYELDGQVIHLGDTVSLKSRKHSADLSKKAIAYEFDALTEEYISITFDDKPGFSGASVSSGLSNAADAILEANSTAQDIAVERALQNANQAFDAEFDKRKAQIEANIEKVRANAEVIVESIHEEITQEFEEFEREYQLAKQVQDNQVANILSQATSAQNLAQQAQQISNQAKADAIAEAMRLAADAKQALEAQLTQTQQSLLSQAQAQSELTKRTEAVEQTANGTKATLTELSKTVNNQTGQIDSVSKRTKTVEEGLTGLTTRYENLQSGFNNLILKSDDLENPHKQSGSNTTVTSDNDYYVITSQGYTSYAWGGMSWNMSLDEVKVGDTFSLLMSVYIDDSVTINGGFVFAIKNHSTNQTAYSYEIAQNIKNRWFDVSLTFTVNRDVVLDNYPFYVYLVKNGKVRIKPPTLVKGPIKPLSHLASTEDIRTEVAEYRQSATENYSNLSKSLQTADGKINDANTLIRQTAEAIKSHAKKSEVDTLAGRVTDTETQITQNAREITKKISRTEVESLVDNKGFATTQTVQTLVTETAGSFERQIIETKRLIPNEYSGNILVNSGSEMLWYRTHRKDFALATHIYAGVTYTVTARWWSQNGSNLNLGIRANDSAPWQWVNLKYKKDIDAWTATFVLRDRLNQGQTISFFNIEPNGTGSADWATLSRGPMPMTAWQPSVGDLITETKFHNVKETVDKYERLIGNGESLSQAIQSASKFERSIVAGGDIYQAIETAKGLVQEVTGADGLKSQMSQLAGSWAIKTLTDAGAISSQINASANSILIEAGKIRFKGHSLVDTIDGFSAKFEKIIAGEGDIVKLKSEIIDTKAIEGKHIKFDESFFKFLTAEDAMMKFLFAQRAFATELGAVKFTATQISGGVMRALNDAMRINLNQGGINFYTSDAALKRVLSGYPTQFLKFDTGTFTQNGTRTPMGVTVLGSSRAGDEDSNQGAFAGIRIWNGFTSASNFVDQVDVLGDEVYIAHKPYTSYDTIGTSRGWKFSSYGDGANVSLMPFGNYATSYIEANDFHILTSKSTYTSLRTLVSWIQHNFEELDNRTGGKRSNLFNVRF